MDINELGELNTSEDVQKSGIDYSEGSLILKLPNCGSVNVDPEFIPYNNSIISSGRFHCLYVDPQHGTSTFYIEHDKNCCWVCERKPPFVNQDFIEMVGKAIDDKNH